MLQAILGLGSHLFTVAAWLVKRLGPSILSAAITVYAGIYALTTPVFEQFWATIPPGIQNPLAAFVVYFEYANHWIPIGEVLIFAAAVTTFLVAMIVLKFTIKTLTVGLG